MKLAIIAGSSVFESKIFEGWEKLNLETPYGNVDLSRKGDIFFLQRHGKDLLPPHRINHRANIYALKSLGVEGIVGVCSVGSLKETIRPGTFVIPHDFFCPWQIPTFFDGECRFTVPSLDENLALLIFNVGKMSGMKIKKGGVYVQTLGPRLETVSEIKFLRNIGDVVGMTMASEATLASEVGIPYASLCSVDNFCHGLGKLKLSIEELKEAQRRSLSKIEDFLKNLVNEAGR